MMGTAFSPTLATRLKNAVIRGGLEAIALSGLTALNLASAGEGVIFTLHHVRPYEPKPFEPNRLLEITPDFLDEALTAVKAAGCEFIRLEDVPERLAAPGRRRFACFTLDDGNRDNLTHAAPVFRAHGAPYTVFVTPGFVERQATMWWETLAAMLAAADELMFDFGAGPVRLSLTTPDEKQDAFELFSTHVATEDEERAVAAIDALARSCGIDPLAIVDTEIVSLRELWDLAADPLCSIGAHTLTHLNVKRLAPSRLEHELVESGRRIETWLGRRPPCFAYPYGYKAAAGEREGEAAIRAGYRLGVTTQPGVLRRASIRQPGLLPRVSLNGHFQKARYVRAMASGLPFALL